MAEVKIKDGKAHCPKCGKDVAVSEGRRPEPGRKAPCACLRERPHHRGTLHHSRSLEPGSLKNRSAFTWHRPGREVSFRRRHAPLPSWAPLSGY